MVTVRKQKRRWSPRLVLLLSISLAMTTSGKDCDNSSQCLKTFAMYNIHIKGSCEESQVRGKAGALACARQCLTRTSCSAFSFHEDTLRCTFCERQVVGGLGSKNEPLYYLSSDLMEDLLQTNRDGTCYKGMFRPGLKDRTKTLVLGSLEALCDTRTDGGGWIIIQRRTKGDVDFYRGWEDYKLGFGDITSDYWLGNEAIHELTNSAKFELRIDMIFAKDGHSYYAQYSTFKLSNESHYYTLNVGGYAGDGEDGFLIENNLNFSTHDSDNDRSSDNCASAYGSGWWFGSCYRSDLNGEWATDKFCWIHTELTYSEMKIRQL